MPKALVARALNHHRFRRGSWFGGTSPADQQRAIEEAEAVEQARHDANLERVGQVC